MDQKKNFEQILEDIANMKFFGCKKHPDEDINHVIIETTNPDILLNPICTLCSHDYSNIKFINLRKQFKNEIRTSLDLAQNENAKN